MNKYTMSLFIFFFLTGLKISNADILITDHNYVLTITQVANHPPVLIPSNAIPDSCYQLVNDNISYMIRFSESFDSVFIDSLRVGQKDKVDSGKIYYKLTAGRFIIWEYNSTLNAEFTQYGSGVPVIKSERGVLKSTETSNSHIIKPKALKTDKAIIGSQNHILLNGRIIKNAKIGNLHRKTSNVYLKSIKNKMLLIIVKN